MSKLFRAVLAASLIASTGYAMPAHARGGNMGAFIGGLVVGGIVGGLIGHALSQNDCNRLGGPAFEAAQPGYVSPGGWVVVENGYYRDNRGYACRRIAQVANGYRIPDSERVVCSAGNRRWFMVQAPMFIAVAPARPILLPPLRPHVIVAVPRPIYRPPVVVGIPRPVYVQPGPTFVRPPVVLPGRPMIAPPVVYNQYRPAYPPVTPFVGIAR